MFDDAELQHAIASSNAAAGPDEASRERDEFHSLLALLDRESELQRPEGW